MREPVIIGRCAPPARSASSTSSGEHRGTAGAAGSGRRGPPSVGKNSLASSILPVVVAKPCGLPSGPGSSCLAYAGGCQ